MQLAHGHWENICLQSENHTHLSSHFAKGCYSLSHPWALIQCKSPKRDPIYTLLYAGSHIPPILPFHLKITSPSVKWVTTTQIKTPCRGKLWQSPKVTERMAGAVGSCRWLLLLMATRTCWHRRTCWGQRLCGTFYSQTPLPLRRHHMSQTQPWIRTFPLPLAWVLCYLSSCLPQCTVPDHLPFPTLCSTTGPWDGMNYTFPHENMDT